MMLTVAGKNAVASSNLTYTGEGGESLDQSNSNQRKATLSLPKTCKNKKEGGD